MQNPCGWEIWGGRCAICWPKHHPLGGLSTLWYQLQCWLSWHVAHSQGLVFPSNMSSENSVLSTPVFSCWVLDMPVSCPGGKGSDCGEIRVWQWGGYLPVPLSRSCVVVPQGSAALGGSSWAVRAKALLLGGGCTSFKWCSRYHSDPVVLLVGKLFQYFASPVVRNIFLIASLL